jgi:hypothetical protein
VLQINKNTWHYKLYCWTYTTYEGECFIPTNTNLCQYLNRIFWMTIWCALISATTLVIYATLTPIVFLFGFRPAGSQHSTWWVRYPGFRVWGQVRLYPWVIVVPSLVIYLAHLWIKQAGWMYPTCVLGCLLLFLVFFILILWYQTSDAGSLISKWIEGKKRGICPLVQFTDEE